MTLYPAVFKRAQEEIDRVVGDDRLPSFTDRNKLPYINAIVKETLRWENVAPTGPSSAISYMYGLVLTRIDLQVSLTLHRKKIRTRVIAFRRVRSLFQMSGIYPLYFLKKL